MTNVNESQSLTCNDISDEELAEISSILSMQRSFDISSYKLNFLRRRVAIRMRSSHCSTAGQYCNLLRQNTHELDLLQKTITIHVSQFFRNPSMFDKLAKDILPALFAGKAGRPLTISCLGCASGEEPYSLAILLKEHFTQELRRKLVTIVATDVDAATLQAAQTAVYSADRLKETADELIDRYFRHDNGQYTLAREIREMVTFVEGDITDVQKLPASDLVLCRNTLIYFSHSDQERILAGIAETVPVGGFLVLGKSETLVGEARRRFEPVCPVERIYRRL